MTHSAYEHLAGLSGSVATAADAMLRMEAAESQTVVLHLFRHLVTVDETGRASRRYAPLAEIAEGVSAEATDSAACGNRRLWPVT